MIRALYCYWIAVVTFCTVMCEGGRKCCRHFKPICNTSLRGEQPVFFAYLIGALHYSQNYVSEIRHASTRKEPGRDITSSSFVQISFSQ